MFTRSFALRAFPPPSPCNPVSHSLFSSQPTWRAFRTSAPLSKAARASKSKPSSRTPRTTTPKPQAQQQPPQPQQKQPQHSPTDSLKFAGRRPDGFGKLERKVLKDGTLLLFQSPSNKSYVAGAYSIAAFAFAFSINSSFEAFVDPLLNLKMWQQGLFAGICVMMSGMGTIVLSKTTRLIRAVHAVNVNGRAYLRFTVRSMIPFRRAWTFDALPREIAFSRRLVVSSSAKTMQHAELERAAQGVKVSFWKNPSKKVSMFFWTIFRSIRQIFTQEDFVLLEAEGQKGVFRMDSAGYVAPEFLVIGNPVDIAG